MERAVSLSSSAVSITVPITSVQISLQALLKIIQHAREMTPSPVTGQLLGMENGCTLEITDMFPYAAAIQDELEQEEYQLEMMKSLRDVNVDHNTVGWYQSMALDGFISSVLVDAQAHYQSTIANSVLLLYDHLRSCLGSPVLRALRLKADFMTLYCEKKSRSLSSYLGTGMFDELEIKVSLSAMDQMFLAQLSQANQLPPIAAIQLPEIEQLMLAKVTDNLIVAVDEILAETGRLQHYIRSSAKHHQALSSQRLRRRYENAQRLQAGEEPLPEEDILANFRPPSEPSRMPYMLSSSQLHALLADYNEHFTPYSNVDSVNDS